MNPPVFFGAGLTVIGFCIFGAAFTSTAGSVFEAVQPAITRTFGWYYVLGVASLLGFAVWLMVSPVRSIRLGGPMLDHFPLAIVTKTLATVVITLFFVTSSDSGSLVDDMVTSGGRPNPPRAQRVFWASAEGLAAATLLLAGGLQAMRNASISLGMPMSVLLVAVAVSLARALRADPQVGADNE